MMFVRPLQFGQSIGLPRQHWANRIFLDQQFGELLGIIALPGIFTLEGWDEKLLFVDLVEGLGDLYLLLLGHPITPHSAHPQAAAPFLLLSAHPAPA